MSETNIKVLCAALAALALAGCGNTGGGSASDDDPLDGEFVDGGATTGTIDLQLVSETLPVATTTGFFVSARDNKNNPIKLMRLTCDTERGVVIVEPTTGSEFTDDGGRISGRIGCNSPGSYQMVCRGPIGLNRQDAVTVRCSGDIPAGFAGFTGAGGTLGNGSGGGGSGDGGNGSDDPQNTVLIETVDVFDGGESNALAIDALFSTDCDPDTTGNQPEPFFINSFAVKLKNNGTTQVTVTSVSVFVPAATGSNTGGIRLPLQRVNEVIAPNGGTGNVTGLLTDVDAGAAKNFAGTSTSVSTIGLRNVSFTISGETEDGRDFEITTARQVSFTAIDNCAR